MKCIDNLLTGNNSSFHTGSLEIAGLLRLMGNVKPWSFVCHGVRVK